MAKDDSQLFWQEGEFLPGFNVRCYGLLERDGQILVSKENYNGPELVKFPGGGLEFQEAPEAALRREFQEELDIDVDVGPCYYVSPQFHRSYFRKQQLIALYWPVIYSGEILLPDEPQAFADDPSKTQWLYWAPIKELQNAGFTHPLDQEVAKKICQEGL